MTARAPSPFSQAFRRDPAAKEILRQWRALTGGASVRDGNRRTLLACSGGADSSALVIALASAARTVIKSLVVGHVVHDLRPVAQAHADRDAARSLAEKAGLPFDEASVHVKASKGNAEGVARDKRYEALAALAKRHQCAFVAVAHQGDDSLETILLRLMRGAGPVGLGGVRPVRTLESGVCVVRPMLTLSRADSERICTLAGWRWRHDATNDDTTRMRAAVRATITPALRALCPTIHQRAATSARLIGECGEIAASFGQSLAEAGRSRDGNGYRWGRAELAARSGVVLGEAIRHTVLVLTGGIGADRLSHDVLARAAGIIKDDSTAPRTVRTAGCVIRITSRVVEVVRDA